MNDLTLLQPRTLFVEPIRPSGFTPSGIYILDNDETRDMAGNDASMLVRVLEAHPSCDPEVLSGEVYICNLYSWDTITHGTERYNIMHEDNLLVRLDGYDEAA